MDDRHVFSGFPQAGLHFLADLAESNNREWFQEHKNEYLDYVLAPAQDFVFALGERLKDISPNLRYDPATNGTGSILRIYRDIRFSKDKTPYNTQVRMVFWEGNKKKMENPSFFVSVRPAGVGIYAGVHVFSKPLLAAYRDAVADEQLGSDLETALTSVKSAGDYTIGGQHYKRVPRGYDAEHPRADLLRYNGLYAHAQAAGPEAIVTPELVDICFAHLQHMAPLHRWLVRVVQLFEV
jgi:uncharacterized protein (TIGR02453 family)